MWHVYPETQEIVVYQPDGSARTYDGGQIIPGGVLLPGFALDVTAIFDE